MENWCMVWEIGRSKALGQPEKGRAGKQRFRLLLGFQAARAGRQRNVCKPVTKGKRQRQPEKGKGRLGLRLWIFRLPQANRAKAA